MKPPSEKLTATIANIPDEAVADNNREAIEEVQVQAKTTSQQRPTHEEVKENMRQMTEQVEEAVTFIQSLNPNELKVSKTRAERGLDQHGRQSRGEAPNMSKVANKEIIEVK